MTASSKLAGQGLRAPAQQPVPIAGGARLDWLAAGVTAQVVGQVPRGRVAAGGRLGHGLQTDCLQVARRLVVKLARRPGLVVQHLQQQHPPVAPEWAFPGQHLVEDNAQAVDVAAHVDLMGLAARLFGRHVGRRSQHLAIERQRRLVGLALGQTEIHQVRPLLRVEHDVGGLDVAVDHALAMGVAKCVGHLGDQLGGPAHVERSRAKTVRQRHALDKLFDEKAGAFLGLPGVVERDDAGVLKVGGAARLSGKPIDLIPARELPGAQDLDGHQPVKFGVARLEHRPKGADPEFFQELELAQATRSTGAKPAMARFLARRGTGHLDQFFQEWVALTGLGRKCGAQRVQQRIGPIFQVQQSGGTVGALLDVLGYPDKDGLGRVPEDEPQQLGAIGATRCVHQRCLSGRNRFPRWRLGRGCRSKRRTQARSVSEG